MTRVLYIEDEPNNRMLVRRLFMAMASDLNYSEADNARAGIQMAIDNPFDIILMDISMPDMDGITATGVIRKTDSIKDTPIIALTANAMEGDRERFLAAGCDGYISKPIDIDTFIDNVRDYIKRIPEILKKRTTQAQSSGVTGPLTPTIHTRPATQSARPKDWDTLLAAKQASAAKPTVTPSEVKPTITATPQEVKPSPVTSATPAPAEVQKPAVTVAPQEVKPVPATPVTPNEVKPAVAVTPQEVKPVPVTPVTPSEVKPATAVAPQEVKPTPATQPVVPTPVLPTAKPDNQGEKSPTQAAPIESTAPVTPKSQDAVEAKPAQKPEVVEVRTAQQQEHSSNGGGQ